LIRKNPMNPTNPTNAIDAMDAINAMNLRPKNATVNSRLIFNKGDM